MKRLSERYLVGADPEIKEEDEDMESNSLQDSDDTLKSSICQSNQLGSANQFIKHKPKKTESNRSL